MTDARTPNNAGSKPAQTACERRRGRLRAGVDYRAGPAVFDALGDDLVARLTSGQLRRVALRLTILSAWLAFARVNVVRNGTRLHAMRDFVAAACAEYECVLSVRTFSTWLRRLARFGPRGLIDYRGRCRGRRMLDAVCVVRFVGYLQAGTPFRTAHALVAEFAQREGRAWPSLRSLYLRLAAERGVAERPARRVNETGGYLLAGLSVN